MTKTEKSPSASNPYIVYVAGEMFTQHDLLTNVYLKDAIIRVSEGRFQLILPQSKELRNLDRPDMAAFIRNQDLLNVIGADVILARFDGLELDSGTVVEFMMAKFLGKPAVILRSDTRRMSSDVFDEPYNLMTKNWPRTVTVHHDAMIQYIQLFIEEMAILESGGPGDAEFQAELRAANKGVNAIASKIVEGLDEALALPSPYSSEYQELVYQISRFAPGSGFDNLVSVDEITSIIQRLKQMGTL